MYKIDEFKEKFVVLFMQSFNLNLYDLV